MLTRLLPVAAVFILAACSSSVKSYRPLTGDEKAAVAAFGCDICQDVCPWNRFSKPTHEIRFAPKEHWQQNSKEQWLSIEEEVFKKMVKGTPLERSKWKGFLNNLRHLEGDL